MKNKILSIILIVLVAIGGLSFLIDTRKSQAQQQLTIWEYKFESPASERRANELGTQGWELVAIQSPSTAGLNNQLPIYVYKRAKPFVEFPPN